MILCMTPKHLQPNLYKKKKKKTLRLLELRVKMKATLAYVSKVSTTVSTPETMVDKVKQNKWSLSLASQHLNTEQLSITTV